MVNTERIWGVFLRDVAAAAYEAANALLASAPPPSAAGTIVPLYSRPMAGTTLSPTWRTVIAAKLVHPNVPVVVIANPNSGPGAAVEASYTAGISEMTKAGVVVAGYVSTKYGARPEASVRADIDKWRAWYPAATALFLDEMDNHAGGEGYYLRTGEYAKSVGVTMTIGNPGADTLASYVGALDTIVVYEKAGLPTASFYSGWHAKYPRANFGLMAYGVPALDTAFLAAARATIGWIFLTDDVLSPNPWDSVPPYFGQLLASLI